MTQPVLPALQDYFTHRDERSAEGLPAKALNAEQTHALVEALQTNPTDEYVGLLTDCVPPGADPAAYVKAAYLVSLVKEEANNPLIDSKRAVFLLGTMLGGVNVNPLVECLTDSRQEIVEAAVAALSKTLLVFDAFNDVADLCATNKAAQQVMQNWAEGTWLTSRPEIAESVQGIVFKVPGEINTDDLSPAPDAWSRPDIPLHGQSMLKKDRPGVSDPLGTIEKLKESGRSVIFAGDVVGTGSSRKSAANSLMWHIGDDIPFIPNKRTGGYTIGGKIAPIFYNTLEDAGSIGIEASVDQLETGTEVELRLHDGLLLSSSGETLAEWKVKPEVLQQARAGGRIALIIGRGLTAKARQHLGLSASPLFAQEALETPADTKFTLAQKMVGKACGVNGVLPSQYCEPHMTTVGSQDTTGPMTRDELKELACLGFSADLVMQSFCHTAAYPKPVDIELQHTLPEFIKTRGGVSLQPGDGIIHSWLNRMLLPDTVGTGGDSHTRFPLGISFPAGSGLVAFAAAIGIMPLRMPESVLVRFTGEMQKGITLRDLVNAIPYAALKSGDLTLDKKSKKNVFNGRILEIEGLPKLKVEQAFEFSDASAERSCAGCTVKLDKEPIIEYLSSNVVMLRWLISEGYGDARTLERRARAMEEWLENPQLMEADAGAEYAAVLEIDLNEITEPLLAAPNDPDDIRPLTDVAQTDIDEVFIGSCMTNIGQFRAAGELLRTAGETKSKLWISPPTRMDKHQLEAEGYYDIYKKVGAQLEVPGCSLCMGNQARVADNATVVSTSTRNFPNRLGDGANVFLSSSELAALSSVLGRLPSKDEYLEYMDAVEHSNNDLYRYLNFHEMQDYKSAAETIASRDILS